MSIIEEKETRERLLASVKKEVKQLMEEAVTKKFVHEDSACITSLCSTIESCLVHGLKRRAIGLFKTSTTMALLEKLSKNLDIAANIIKMCEDYEENYEKMMNNNNNQNNNAFINNISKKFFNHQTSNTSQDLINNYKGRNFAPTFYKGSNCYKYLWIRLALLNKSLHKIIEFIVNNADKYYSPFALVADPVDGPIFSSLLVGPCALEFTKLKTCDHLWTDPNADELIQRYKMHNSICSNNSSIIQSPKPKLGLNASIILKRNASTSSASVDDTYFTNSMSSPIVYRTHLNSAATPSSVATTNSTSNTSYFSSPFCQNSTVNTSNQINSSTNTSTVISATNHAAKEYVESLHQNNKSQLIYGKNHVIVFPKEEMDGLPGYLSLHLTMNTLTLKWTPNQLMNGSLDEAAPLKTKSAFWDYAINVDLNSVVYLHCHQRGVSGAVIVLVGQDGVQYPPICFPKGSHLLQFLQCLEAGLAPNGYLDPPLVLEEGIGKTFPKIKNQQKQTKSNGMDNNQTKTDVNNNNSEEQDDYEPTDFIFRIITNNDSMHSSPISMNNSPQNLSIFRHFFNSSNPISSLLSTFSTPNTPPNSADLFSPPTNQLQGSFINMTKTQAPPTPPNSASSMTSAIIGSKDLAQSTPLITTINPAPKLTKSLSVRSSMRLLCDTMRRQILSRAFYGWLAYCRHLKTIRVHLIGLVKPEVNEDGYSEYKQLNSELWSSWLEDEEKNGVSLKTREILFHRIVYYAGIQYEMRKTIWPFLLNHYTFSMTIEERKQKDIKSRQDYERLISEWSSFEELIRLKDQSSKPGSLNMSIDSYELTNMSLTSTCKTDSNTKEVTQNKKQKTSLNLTPILSKSSKSDNLIKLTNMKLNGNNNAQLRNDLILLRKDSSLSNEVFIEDLNTTIELDNVNTNLPETSTIPEETASECQSRLTSPMDDTKLIEEQANEKQELKNGNENNSAGPLSPRSRQTSTSSFRSFDDSILHESPQMMIDKNETINNDHDDDDNMNTPTKETDEEMIVENNGITKEGIDIRRKSLSDKTLLDNFATNIHRIDKDVTRCDRNYPFFMSNDNLQKLRNIMYTFVWENLNMGYIQGMCDLVAPLLVIYDDESLTYSCFKELMKRMAANFPHGNEMDKHFASMRSLIQILDANLFEHMHQRGDYTHFYFSYRWFLLDFKRELVYDDVFSVWETIWAGNHVCSSNFSLFIALALVETYRDIIIDNNMDFTDIIKFFNEMAEKHNAQHVLNLARDLVKQLQNLIFNKDDY